MNRREFSALAASMLTSGSLHPRHLIAASPIGVNGVRLNRHLAELSRFGTNPSGGVTRLAYTDANREALLAVAQWMREARLQPALDHAGNLIGRRAGGDRTLKPIVFGSHIDRFPRAAITTVTSAPWPRSKSRTRSPSATSACATRSR